MYKINLKLYFRLVLFSFFIIKLFYILWLQVLLIEYLARFSQIADNSVNCGPVLNWFQMDNKGHRLLVPSEESRSINTPAVAAAYSVRRYVSQVEQTLTISLFRLKWITLLGSRWAEFGSWRYDIGHRYGQSGRIHVVARKTGVSSWFLSSTLCSYNWR